MDGLELLYCCLILGNSLAVLLDLGFRQALSCSCRLGGSLGTCALCCGLLILAAEKVLYIARLGIVNARTGNAYRSAGLTLEIYRLAHSALAER